MGEVGCPLQVTRGLAYVHSKDAAHRDIKPENILLSDGVFPAKLGDFGARARGWSVPTSVR